MHKNIGRMHSKIQQACKLDTHVCPPSLSYFFYFFIFSFSKEVRRAHLELDSAGVYADPADQRKEKDDLINNRFEIQRSAKWKIINK